MSQEGDRYPVQLSADYSDRGLNRTATFFRLIVIIPILIVLVFVSGSSSDDKGGQYATAGAGGALFFAPLLMILFRQKYPRWWFDWIFVIPSLSSLGRECYLLFAGCNSKVERL